MASDLGILLAWAAHQNALGLAPVLAYLGAICWTVFYDTIYSHQDREDDVLIGVKSTARLFGARTKLWLAGFLGATTLILALAIAATGAQGLSLGIAYLGLGCFALHLLWQWVRLDNDNGDLCLRLFRSNRDAGLILTLFLVAAALV